MGNQGMCGSDTRTLQEQYVVCGKQPQFKNSTTINLINSIPIINGPPLNFHKQGTFQKVEKSASQFCVKNQLDRSYIPLVARIIAYQHTNIFKAYQRLPLSRRQSFLGQIKFIDFEFLDSLYHNFILQQKKQIQHLSSPFNLVDRYGINEGASKLYREAGLKVIKNRQIGFLFLCAGSSSRFVFQDKFLHPLNIKSQKSILQLLFDRIRRNLLIPEGYTVDVPIVIACNSQNRFVIENFLKQRKYFGFNVSKMRFMTIRQLPILQKNGKTCLTFQYKILQRPPGTAKCIEQFMNSNSFSFFKSQNVSVIHALGCENIGQNPGDPFFIGYLVQNQLQMLGKCVDPLFPSQDFIRYAGGPNNKNYAVSVQSIAQSCHTNKSEAMEKCPIALNSIICRLQGLKTMVKQYTNSLFLSRQFRAIKRTQSFYNFQQQKPEYNQNVTVFQKDIQTLLTCSNLHRLIKIQRQDFIPIITKYGLYSIKEASKKLIEVHEHQLSSEQDNFNRN